MNKLFIGTSGYNYREWQGEFYPVEIPQKEWLQYYDREFSSLEINATFYRSFPSSVYEKWYETTGDGFSFVLKGPRSITHIKRLKDVGKELEVFFTTSASLKEKRSCVLWQFAANFKKNEKNADLLQDFFTHLPKSLRHVIELRHETWFTDEIYTMLEGHNIGFVINDSNKFPSQNVVTADFAYIRFHGPKELYASAYSTQELSDWAAQIKEWILDKDVYCYFNNDMGGHAFRNAKELMKLTEQMIQ